MISVVNVTPVVAFDLLQSVICQSAHEAKAFIGDLVGSCCGEDRAAVVENETVVGHCHAFQAGVSVEGQVDAFPIFGDGGVATWEGDFQSHFLAHFLDSGDQLFILGISFPLRGFVVPDVGIIHGGGCPSLNELAEQTDIEGVESLIFAEVGKADFFFHSLGQEHGHFLSGVCWSHRSSGCLGEVVEDQLCLAVCRVIFRSPFFEELEVMPTEHGELCISSERIEGAIQLLDCVFRGFVRFGGEQAENVTPHADHVSSFKRVSGS